MQVFFGIETLQAEWNQSVVCIGTFDGVHLGHRAVIGRAVSRAREMGLPAVLLTFDQNPAGVLAPDKCPPAIASLQSNLEEFEALGVSIAMVLRFDRAFSEITAEDFYGAILVGQLHAKAVVIGHDFTFGKDRKGTPAWLASQTEAEIVAPFLIDGERVSSSRIRSAVASGDLRLAANLLGRPFEIPGVVVAGEHRGRAIGFPTVNLGRSFKQVTPPDGVYAASCRTPFGEFKAAASIGGRPTVDEQRTIEAFLVDYPGNELYGAAIRLSLVEKLRDVEKFPSLESLRKQIEADIEEVLRVH